MTRKLELAALVLVDAIALNVANVLHYKVRFEWLWFGEPEIYPVGMSLVGATLTVFWLLIFTFFGLYRERYADSRFDELVSLFKVVSIGILILVFAIYIDALAPGSTRAAILFYWVAVFGATAVGRIAVRSVQKFLLLRGYGTHNAVIVGWSDRVEQLYEEVARYPEAGLNILGAVRLDRDPGNGDVDVDDEVGPDFEGAATGVVLARRPAPRVRAIAALPKMIDRLGIQDVLIALGSEDHDALMEVLRVCDGKPVRLKIVPDFYSVIGGMSRTEHMYGLPLIEVLPEPMPAWEVSTKRLLDIAVAVVVLGLGLPFWLLIGIGIRLTSTGPAIYRQQRVGRNGKIFTMFKFRTMHNNAEAETGPVWAVEDDPRYTPLGRWLRRTRLDEVPQFWNVLKGNMSLVGPRPERPYFVSRLADEIPLYNRRHRVKPGITGWAQVKWKYDTTLEDVHQKVKYDLFYIENMSLRMDSKILFRTIRTALSGKGR
ncbi:MAG: sugar transferase [Rhodothermales bacterium]|nr:sugar transferase [Rhodothermales bacterium]